MRHGDLIGAGVCSGAVAAMPSGLLFDLWSFGRVISGVFLLFGLAQNLLHHLLRLLRGGPEQ